jgi:hypothetical protein
MHGPDILAHSLSVPAVRSSAGPSWQYHNRSDRHSKIACWGIVLDLLLNCPLLRRHVGNGRVFFGINHEMRDFQQNRKKDLDVVLCTAGSGNAPAETLRSKAADYAIALDSSEEGLLNGLPELSRKPVGSVLVALEAKACMTAHQKALPRLYDELNSSHLTVHGATDEAIAAGFVMVNAATSFISPTKGAVPNLHRQPFATEIVKSKVAELPRRSAVGRAGFDALAVVVVDCQNDGSPVSLVPSLSPPVGDSFNYESMIHRLAQLYATRFHHL